MRLCIRDDDACGMRTLGIIIQSRFSDHFVNTAVCQHRCLDDSVGSFSAMAESNMICKLFHDCFLLVFICSLALPAQVKIYVFSHTSLNEI